MDDTMPLVKKQLDATVAEINSNLDLLHQKMHDAVTINNCYKGILILDRMVKLTRKAQALQREMYTLLVARIIEVKHNKDPV